MSRAAGNLLFALVVSAAVLIGVVASHWRRPAPPRPAGSLELCGPDTHVLPRLKAKQRIIEDVIAGHYSLREAAAAFKALDRDGRAYPIRLATGTPSGGSEEEAYCRSVIAWLRAQERQERGQELARQFETELAVRLRDGTPRLPD